MAPKPTFTHHRLVPWMYDTILTIFSLALTIFFREIYPRGAYKIPRHGPVIIVAAPHANQFVDSAVLMHILKKYAKRRVSFLIAAKSMREPYIGTLAGRMGALPVERAIDSAVAAKGRIYLPHPEQDPTLLKGDGKEFEGERFMVGGSIILPKHGKESPEIGYIAEIISNVELRLKKPFKNPGSTQLLTATHEDGPIGTSFKIAPHVNQADVFDVVLEHLEEGGCIGIFPEGGSHDRSDLLPLKAGAALMALGALARNPNCGLTILPCGMNYFHPHKFRSRAVIEFGSPISVHPDQISAYQLGGNDRRNAVGSLLETIYDGLAAVTQISPDHETLTLVQATRRLYNPVNKKLPLALVVEFNRRLLKGFKEYEDHPKVIQLKKAVFDYNRRLRALGLKDHQVGWGDVEERPWWFILIVFLYRVSELLILAVGTLPGFALFWPVFLTAKIISVRKQRKALAASVVKLSGRDVVGTWKILVAMGLAPTLYIYYDVVVTFWLFYNRQEGYYTRSVPWWLTARAYIPDAVPLWFFSISFLGLLVAVTFAALRIGEIGMDVLKSLPPLLVALDPRSADSLVRLQARREGLSDQVTNVINSLGWEVLPDFDGGRRLTAGSLEDEAYQSRLKSMPPSEPSSGARSRRSSFGSGIVSHSSPLKPLSSIDSKDTLKEVNRRIGDVMRERQTGHGASSQAELKKEK